MGLPAVASAGERPVNDLDHLRRQLQTARRIAHGLRVSGAHPAGIRQAEIEAGLWQGRLAEAEEAEHAVMHAH